MAFTTRPGERAELGICVSPDRLNQWLLGNLNRYWKSCAADGLETLRQQDASEALPGDVVAWIALGAARRHYTLATGDVASKSAAGEYAVGLLPGYTAVLNAALAWRATGASEFTYADWISCAEMALEIIADANRRFSPSSPDG
ncbi:MAG: hypothetical protein ACLQFR_10850 [Streptosporangiaceae bacterium]